MYNHLFMRVLDQPWPKLWRRKSPQLVSENQGPLEIIDYGKYGYSFKNMDVNDCADKIETFLKGHNNISMIESAYKKSYGTL